MSLFLTIVHVIVCFMLILVILLQAGRGQGLTGPSFASGNVQSLFGTRASDFLAKATSVSAICFILTCVGLDFLEVRKSKSLLNFSRPNAQQIDVDAIKKALEKVKQDASKTASNTTSAATATAADAAGKVTETVKTTAENTAAAANTAAPDLNTQAQALTKDANQAAANVASAVPTPDSSNKS